MERVFAVGSNDAFITFAVRGKAIFAVVERTGRLVRVAILHFAACTLDVVRRLFPLIQHVAREHGVAHAYEFV